MRIIFSYPTSIPTLFKEKYIASIDGLRALSITAVLLAHFITHYQAESKVGLFFGEVGVNIFFIISGFLITGLLLKEHIVTKQIFLKKFYIRRALRIFPVAFLFILTIVFLAAINKTAVNALSVVGASLYIMNFSYFQLDLSLLHFWSLSVEEQYYLFSPILIKRKFYLYVMMLILFILLIPILKWLHFHNIGYSSSIIRFFGTMLYSLLCRGYGIFIGSFICILYYHGIIPVNKLYKHQGIVFLFFLLSFFTFNYLIVVFSSSIFFLAVVSNQIIENLTNHHLLYRLLNNFWIVWLGKLSYSIYIWQQIFSVKSFIFEAYGLDDRNKILYTSANLIGLLLVAIASYFFFESPILRLKKRFI